MAFYAKDKYTADGSTQSFAVTFPFISREHVTVTADGTAATFTWVNNGQITITSPSSLSSEALIIKRNSSPATLLVDFVDGSNLTESDLDLLATQMFYLAQENIDEGGSVGFADIDEVANAAVSTTAADLLISNGTQFTNVALSGDVTVNSSGVTAIGTSKVVSAMIANDSIVNADVKTDAAIDATKLGNGDVTNTELSYINSVTANVQTAIDNIVAGTVTNVQDSVFTLVDNTTSTKKAQFQCSGISADTTRTLTVPDANDTLVGKATTDTLTNKTLTAPVLNDPTFDVAVGVTAHTGSSQGDGAITSTFVEIATCANPGDAVTLPTAAAGKLVIIANNGTNSADVFPASGDKIDGGSVNVALALAAGSNRIYICQDATDWDTIGAGSFLANLSEDGSPQLGEDLDLVTHDIITTANRDINLIPNGTGDVVLAGDTVKVGDSGAAAVLTSNGAGTLTVTTGGTTDLILNTNSGTASSSIQITDAANGDIDFTCNGTGIINFNDRADYPQVAITSSSNAVAWDAQAAPNAYHLTTENTTIGVPTNPATGAFISLNIKYASTHSMAFNTVFEFAASTAPTFTSATNKVDHFVFRYNGACWQEMGRNLNMAIS